MRRIDELHLDFRSQTAGCFRAYWPPKGARLHVSTLMKRMGIEALCRRPNTSRPEPGHKIFPYPLRKLPVTRPDQVCAMDLTPAFARRRAR